MPDLDAIGNPLPHTPDVAVDKAAAAAFAARIQEGHLRLPSWRGPAFPGTDDGATAAFLLPQVLRSLDILRYGPELAAAIDRKSTLPPGGSEEVQVRIATLQAGACILRALRPRLPRITAVHLDGLLWSAGQRRPPALHPYHRTRSIFY